MELKRLLELAGVDTTKGKAAKILNESAGSRSQNYGAFALWYSAEDGTVQTCQVSPSSEKAVENEIARKFGITTNTLRSDILGDYSNMQYGTAGVQSVVQDALQYIKRQTSTDPDDDDVYAQCESFLNTALARAGKLTSRSRQGANSISACSGCLENDVLVIIYTEPTLEAWYWK